MTSKSLLVNCVPDLGHERCDPYMILKHSGKVKDTFGGLWRLKCKCQIYYRGLGLEKEATAPSVVAEMHWFSGAERLNQIHYSWINYQCICWLWECHTTDCTTAATLNLQVCQKCCCSKSCVGGRSASLLTSSCKIGHSGGKERSRKEVSSP